eukprot:1571854-Prymnesium_polylepis.2
MSASSHVGSTACETCESCEAQEQDDPARAMWLSDVAADLITAAYYSREAVHAQDEFEIDMSKVLFKHKLKAFKLAYPGKLDAISEDDAKMVMAMTVKMTAAR